jgi:prepilin-type N-terminal cleavage/methylation domain-containing protein
MKLNCKAESHAFTVGEMMVVLALFSVVMGASLTAGVALQKSFAAIDSFFATHMQQIRDRKSVV